MGFQEKSAQPIVLDMSFIFPLHPFTYLKSQPQVQDKLVYHPDAENLCGKCPGGILGVCPGRIPAKDQVHNFNQQVYHF
jgi:hypothetical protein